MHSVNDRKQRQRRHEAKEAKKKNSFEASGRVAATDRRSVCERHSRRRRAAATNVGDRLFELVVLVFFCCCFVLLFLSCLLLCKSVHCDDDDDNGGGGGGGGDGGGGGQLFCELAAAHNIRRPQSRARAHARPVSQRAAATIERSPFLASERARSPTVLQTAPRYDDINEKNSEVFACFFCAPPCTRARVSPGYKRAATGRSRRCKNTSSL